MQQVKQNDSMDRPLILVTDDDPLIRAMLQAGLSQAGYAVVEAESGEEAIRVCADYQPRLAILDIQMEGLNGIDTARILYQQYKIPFMFISAHHDKEIVDTAIKEGALGYLVKPIEFSQVLPSVETALVRATEIQSLHSKKENLEMALNQNRDISVAVGILVTHSGLSPIDAEAALRRFARTQRLRMADVAQQIIARANELNHLVSSITKS